MRGRGAGSVQLTKRLLYETIGEQLATQLSVGAAMSATARTTEAPKKAWRRLWKSGGRSGNRTVTMSAHGFRHAAALGRISIRLATSHRKPRLDEPLRRGQIVLAITITRILVDADRVRW